MNEHKHWASSGIFHLYLYSFALGNPNVAYRVSMMMRMKMMTRTKIMVMLQKLRKWFAISCIAFNHFHWLLLWNYISRCLFWIFCFCFCWKQLHNCIYIKWDAHIEKMWNWNIISSKSFQFSKRIDMSCWIWQVNMLTQHVILYLNLMHPSKLC